MTNIESEQTTTKLDGNQPSTTVAVAAATPSLSLAAGTSIPISPSISAKPRVTSSVVPLKKRAIRLPHQRLKLKRSSSSGLHKKQRSYTSVSHLERVKFSLFLKILMHHLQMKDEDFVQQARAVVLDCIKSQREGKLQDTPLMSALKGRLFGLVGKHDWEICKRYLSRYLAYHNIVTEL